MISCRSRFLKTGLVLIAFVIILCCSCGCARQVSSPVQLTQSAIRIELTKIFRQTQIPPGSDPVIANNLPKTATVTAPVPIQPLFTRTPTPIRIIAFDPPTPRPVEPSPTPRNVFPSDLYLDPIAQTETPAPDDPFRIQAADFFMLTAEPLLTTPTLPELETTDTEKQIYLTQNGDTLINIAARFGTTTDQISALFPLPGTRFLNPNLTLFINAPAGRLTESAVKILPDEYVVYSFTAGDYDIANEIIAANGYLARYKETTSAGEMTGIDIVRKISQDYSINPMILLALIEFKSHWVFGVPQGAAERDYPVGWLESANKGLYKQLAWAANTLSAGYYGWRNGTLSEIPYYRYPKPLQPIYFEPSLNAGSVAVQYLFAQLYDWQNVSPAIYSENGFVSVFSSIFGDVWETSSPESIGLNTDQALPVLSLPFTAQERWALTGGPHPSWGTGSPWGALDFAPPSSQTGCAKSDRWVLSASEGVVIRHDKGIVIVDQDGDGREETGWVLLYLHIATDGKVPLGTVLKTGDHIGHPSCEGGNATGSHVHIARKYNGEWIAADGPIPFNLSGWTPYNGALPYQGGMIRGDKLSIANPYGSGESLIYH